MPAVISRDSKTSICSRRLLCSSRDPEFQFVSAAAIPAALAACRSTRNSDRLVLRRAARSRIFRRASTPSALRSPTIAPPRVRGAGRGGRSEDCLAAASSRRAEARVCRPLRRPRTAWACARATYLRARPLRRLTAQRRSRRPRRHPRLAELARPDVPTSSLRQEVAAGGGATVGEFFVNSPTAGGAGQGLVLARARRDGEGGEGALAASGDAAGRATRRRSGATGARGDYGLRAGATLVARSAARASCATPSPSSTSTAMALWLNFD